MPHYAGSDGKFNMIYISGRQMNWEDHSLDNFLNACSREKVVGISINIKAGDERSLVSKTPANSGQSSVSKIPMSLRPDGEITLVNPIEVPYLIHYYGRDSDNDVVLTRSGQPIGVVLFDSKDIKREHPLPGIGDRLHPRQALERYGDRCAQYCASFGYATTMRLAYQGKKESHVVVPRDVMNQQRERIPCSAFI